MLKRLKTVLRTAYGFREDRIVLRLDREATLSQIDEDLHQMAEELAITYSSTSRATARLMSLTGDGYWIPVDAKRGDGTTWLGHERVRSILTSERVRGRHICVVADSCYAGTLLRGTSFPSSLDDQRYEQRLAELARLKSRQVIASGGNEPVSDVGRQGHNLFAWYLLQALKENKEPAVDVENLFVTRIWKPVAEIGGQRPNISRLKTPMDEDGQFVLVRSPTAIESTGPMHTTHHSG